LNRPEAGPRRHEWEVETVEAIIRKAVRRAILVREPVEVLIAKGRPPAARSPLRRRSRFPVSISQTQCPHNVPKEIFVRRSKPARAVAGTRQ
jgi:hypothetical protein